ncbi:poly(A)-specific ribonuclease PARN-like isoform X3 [Cicer arietinum]|uniref:Poly(A)-specific ribonuclease PARN-like isoform X3 n=1 Tax=Cicer arietinum TaxID=3827 RepID=A0A3Q7YE16_CICAR|nr:poly(A)-specific ribonuclease PARN-like isoform X3 [Cicer arietinum]
MASLFQLLLLNQRRSLCTKVPTSKWKVKQVTTSNFNESLEEIKIHISSSDFIAISMEKTGSSLVTPWHRVQPFDTAETAYLKASHSAQRFQLLQFAVCPFSVTDSNNLVAHPYNFLLFPRDELKLGMPAYSFFCQTSHLTSMACQGFDFNASIYEGISYLSRAQESAAKVRLGTNSPSLGVMKSSSPPTIADSVFVERIRLRIKHWRNSCKKSGTKTSKDEEIIISLRNIVLGSELFKSRPCLTIDVCSERQVQLILEMLVDFSDDFLPLVIPSKGGTTQAVRIVLANSKEDKEFMEREVHSLEEKESKKIRGFREVIDLISASQKPVISHNCLNEVDEFESSMHMIFPKVLDMIYLMKKSGTMRKVTNIRNALTFLNTHFFAPVDMEIPDQDTVNKGKIDGLDALRLSYLFMKLCSILKISPIVTRSGNRRLAPELEDFTNVFHPCSTNIQESCSEDVGLWNNNTRKINSEHLVFLWGFKFGMTAGMLKSVLRASHDIFSGEFDVRFVDKSCAIVVFWQPGLSKDFLDVMNSEEIGGGLKELVSDGLRVTCYETYRTMCRLGLWEMDLAESLERALESFVSDTEINNERKSSSEIHWCNDNVINLDDL